MNTMISIRSEEKTKKAGQKALDDLAAACIYLADASIGGSADLW